MPDLVSRTPTEERIYLHENRNVFTERDLGGAGPEKKERYIFKRMLHAAWSLALVTYDSAILSPNLNHHIFVKHLHLQGLNQLSQTSTTGGI